MQTTIKFTVDSGRRHYVSGSGENYGAAVIELIKSLQFVFGGKFLEQSSWALFYGLSEIAPNSQSGMTVFHYEDYDNTSNSFRLERTDQETKQVTIEKETILQ